MAVHSLPRGGQKPTSSVASLLFSLSHPLSILFTFTHTSSQRAPHSHSLCMCESYLRVQHELTLLQYTNVWYSQYMPYVFILLYKFPSTHQNKRISSRGSYDNTGQPYNVTQIINADSSFNEAKYKAYSPLFLSFVIFT